MVARAGITGTPGATSLSGSFGPETQVCRGVAASFTGNLGGNRESLEDDAGDEDES